MRRLADKLDAAKLVFAGCAVASARAGRGLITPGFGVPAPAPLLSDWCCPGKSWRVTASPRSSGSMRRCLPLPDYVPHGYGSSFLGLRRNPRPPAPSASNLPPGSSRRRPVLSDAVASPADCSRGERYRRENSALRAGRNSRRQFDRRSLWLRVPGRGSAQISGGRCRGS
jgi:hypothetical protein